MRYAGRVTALDGVSFEARPGEVLGFLGPNGAGKTTAMRICTGFLAPTAGSVAVCGIDVAGDPLAARARLGYLPESVPLYPELRVEEYLAYRAALKGVAHKDRRARIDEALAAVALVPERRRIIGQLSKGYRQRVGLADALVHEPELIILDEPTIGLDPNQIRSVRTLIKSLANAHTVLISTHILPEAEMTCNRMLIMFEGKILAADTPDNLQRLMSGNGQVIAEIAAPLQDLCNCWAEMPEVEHYDVSPADGEFFRCALTPANGMDLRPHIFAVARDRGWYLRELTRNRHSLEDIYVKITRPPEEEEGA
jgi:ABC-2 type transport system ATP-binding protein